MVQTLNHIANSKARQAELQFRLDRLARPERLELLCLAIDDPYPPLRQEVAEALQAQLHGGDDAPDALDRALIDFLHALVSATPPDEALIDSLGLHPSLVPEPSLRARMTACVALEASPWPADTAAVLSPLLGSDEPDLRYQAVIAAHRLLPADQTLRDIVVKALADEDPEIVVIATQIAVAEAWADLLPEFLHARARLNGEDRLQITFSIGALVDNTALSPGDLPPEARGDLIAECIDALPSEPHTASAIKTLGYLNATEAADALVAVTKRWLTHPILKVEAAAALVDIGHPRGGQYLEKSLSSRRKDARGYALRVIGQRRLTRFFSELVDTATGTGYHADTATLALADFGGPEAREILDKLANSHGDEEIRRLANQAIRRIDHPAPAAFDATLDR